MGDNAPDVCLSCSLGVPSMTGLPSELPAGFKGLDGS